MNTRLLASMLNGYTPTPALIQQDAAIGHQLDACQIEAELRSLLTDRRIVRGVLEARHVAATN